MVYNAIRNGRLASVEHNNTQKIVIPLDEAVAFASRYFTNKERKALKAEKADAEKE